MKLDLDKLESKARQDSDHNTMSEIDPDETLALIARIRELEAALETAVDDLGALRMAHRASALTEILDKGAVLP